MHTTFNYREDSSIRLRGNTSKRELLSETEGWLEGGGAALRTDMLSVKML